MLTNEIGVKCECCLVSGRNLISLKSLNFVHHFNDIPLKGSESICWECKADLLRIWKFYNQVVKAQNLLMNNLYKENFSSLSISKKNTFDFEFEYEEVKTETLDLNDDLLSLSNKNTINSKLGYEEVQIEFDINDDECTTDEYGKEDNTTAVPDAKTTNNHVKATAGENCNIYAENRFALKVLSEKELFKIRDEDRKGKRYKLAPYKCETCILAYFSEDGYKKHMLKLHSEESGNYCCKICSSKFQDELSCSAHFDKHFLSFCCKLCKFESHKLSKILQHYQKEHETWIIHQCDECGQEFGTKRKLRYHRDTKHKVAPKCNICDRTFTTDNSLRVHLEIHTGTMYKCDVCNKSYKGKHGLRNHMKTHESMKRPENSYCAQCDKQFSHAHTYQSHLRNNSKHRTGREFKFKCPLCVKSFHSGSSLNRHKSSIHDKCELFVCHFCSKNYSSKNNLERHINSRHGGPLARKYLCVHCNKGFTEKSILTNHIRTHTGERPFECPQCPSTFSQKSALQTHIKGIHMKLRKKLTKK